MSDVFISYKREDEARVVRLVRALERAGFAVWWDRVLPGSENWQTQIESALDSAKCVIVVWTYDSVGKVGDFVRDEARRAKSHRTLVPVFFDSVEAPLGFGELQGIDLTEWKGRLNDPSFQDLCTVVRAKVDGESMPPAKAPMKRWSRRLTYGSLASALGLIAAGFGLDIFDLQSRTCTLPVMQPFVSDACGVLRIGNQPSRTERLAWTDREQGSCAALRDHLHRFPDGAYRDQATAMLYARRVDVQNIWSPVKHRLSLFVAQSRNLSETVDAARVDAITRAIPSARQLCHNFSVAAAFRLLSFEPEVQEWDCSVVGEGFACSFSGEAVCQLEEQRTQEIETCGD